MSSDVTRLRTDRGAIGLDARKTPGQRLAEIKADMDRELEWLESGLLEDLEAMRVRLEEAAELLAKPGVKEEVRRLAEQMLGTTQRIGALRERG